MGTVTRARRKDRPDRLQAALALDVASAGDARPQPTGVEVRGKSGRILKHPRADWIADPAVFGLPEYDAEYRFHPGRQWRFDFAWPAARVALEVDGGSGGYGRHSRPGGMRKDHDKLNAAALMGWTVLRVLAGEERRLATLTMLTEALCR